MLRRPQRLRNAAGRVVSGLWIGDEDSRDFAAVGGHTRRDARQLLGGRPAGRYTDHGGGRRDRARHLRGLAGFTDDVTVAKDPGVAVSDGIADSLMRNAAVDADKVKVSDSGGNVTLSGTVRSYAEKREAVRSAWLAPGVVSVDDQLVITG